MANPTATIRAGLDAHERAKVGPTKPKLAVLAGVTGDIPSISKICASVRNARARLVQLRAFEVTDAAKAVDAIRLDWKDRGVSIDENNIRSDSFTGTERRKFIEADVKAARKERMAATADERAKLAGTLREAKASLDLVRGLWSSPVAVLMRSTLASERRATYTANLAAAGPKEVDDAMRVAVSTGDKDLAAAACVRIDAMGREPRKLLKYSKADGAEELVSKEFGAATEALGTADYYRESGDLVARELEGRRVSPNDKIRVGAKRAALEAELGKSLDVDGNATDPEGNPTGETLDERLDRKYPGGALPPGYTIIENDGSERHE